VSLPRPVSARPGAPFSLNLCLLMCAHCAYSGPSFPLLSSVSTCAHDFGHSFSADWWSRCLAMTHVERRSSGTQHGKTMDFSSLPTVCEECLCNTESLSHFSDLFIFLFGFRQNAYTCRTTVPLTHAITRADALCMACIAAV